MQGKVLVLGATGNIGRQLVQRLKARGEVVKAASRSGTAVEGAEGVVFEMADPATLDAALEGVDRAFVMWPSGQVPAKEPLVRVIDTLAARRIKVVLLSVIGVDADDNIPLRQVELALEASGTPFVILRPNWFADNFHTYWKHDIAQGRIAVPAAQGQSSFIDVRDIAASAAAALTGSQFDGRAFNLTGPQALGYADAAALLSRALNQSIRYTPVDDASFVRALTSAGLSDEYAHFLASIFYPVREGWTAVVTDHVEQLTGRVPYSLTTYVQDHLKDLAA